MRFALITNEDGRNAGQLYASGGRVSDWERERDAFYDAQAWVSVCGERDALTGWREGQGEEREIRIGLTGGGFECSALRRELNEFRGWRWVGWDLSVLKRRVRIFFLEDIALLRRMFIILWILMVEFVFCSS